MCLYIDWEKTRKAKKNKIGKVVRWKVVDVYCHSLISIFQFSYKWKPGWNKSDRNTARFNETYEVNLGIHVFTSRKEARRISLTKIKIVKVVCYKKDLVAVGLDNDEVYTKVFLPKDEHDDAIKRKGKERKSK